MSDLRKYNIWLEINCEHKKELRIRVELLLGMSDHQHIGRCKINRHRHVCFALATLPVLLGVKRGGWCPTRLELSNIGQSVYLGNLYS